MPNAKLKVVPLEEATDAELIIAASFAGADESEGEAAAVVELATIDQRQREVLITFMNAIGYYNIQIDPNERVETPDALVAFEVALPV